MSSSSRTIPPLLQPYLTPPTTTPSPNLVLATSILGASTNWLLLRYLYSFLKQPPQQDDSSSSSETTTTVLLISFLRDHTFWKESSSRIGLDLDGLARSGRFAYIDGLNIDLFHSTNDTTRTSSTGLSLPSPSPITSRLPSGPSPRPNPITPGRHQPPTRGPVPVLGGRIPPPPTTSATKTTESPPAFTNPNLAHIKKVITDAVDKLDTQARSSGKKSKLVLVIDQLDFLLAAGGDEVSASALRELLLDLREMADTTVLTLSADQPLIDEQNTTLEKEHANFVLSLVHEAAMVLSLRLLDTGVAKDVSGVIRITAGGDKLHGTVVEENEYLYHVRGDGSVNVFERGQ